MDDTNARQRNSQVARSDVAASVIHTVRYGSVVMIESGDPTRRANSRAAPIAILMTSSFFMMGSPVLLRNGSYKL